MKDLSIAFSKTMAVSGQENWPSSLLISTLERVHLNWHASTFLFPAPIVGGTSSEQTCLAIKKCVTPGPLSALTALSTIPTKTWQVTGKSVQKLLDLARINVATVYSQKKSYTLI